MTEERLRGKEEEGKKKKRGRIIGPVNASIRPSLSIVRRVRRIPGNLSGNKEDRVFTIY
jgi:hypothetical protein